MIRYNWFKDNFLLFKVHSSDQQQEYHVKALEKCSISGSTLDQPALDWIVSLTILQGRAFGDIFTVD